MSVRQLSGPDFLSAEALVQTRSGTVTHSTGRYIVPPIIADQ